MFSSVFALQETDLDRKFRPQEWEEKDSCPQNAAYYKWWNVENEFSSVS